MSFAQHRRNWKYGCGAGACDRAQNVVLAKGVIPCDVLFVAEAPGASEDSIGLPLVGPTGMSLDDQIGRAAAECSVVRDWRFAYTNVVGCIPTDEDGLNAGPPDAEAVEKCRPRLEEFVAMADPKLIVCVGTVAHREFESGPKGARYVHTVKHPIGCKVIGITHPAYMLRAPAAQRGMLERRNVVLLMDAFEAVFGVKE